MKLFMIFGNGYFRLDKCRIAHGFQGSFPIKIFSFGLQKASSVITHLPAYNDFPAEHKLHDPTMAAP